VLLLVDLAAVLSVVVHVGVRRGAGTITLADATGAALEAICLATQTVSLNRTTVTLGSLRLVVLLLG